MDIAGGGVIHSEAVGGKQVVQKIGLRSRLVHSADGERRRLRVQSYRGPSLEEIEEDARGNGQVYIYARANDRREKRYGGEKSR